jgi:DNA-binding MarR family transcriptional regulator
MFFRRIRSNHEDAGDAGRNCLLLLPRNMPKRADLPLTTLACNSFYENVNRRAWALVAFMVEHEEFYVDADGSKQNRDRDSKGRKVFRRTELNKQVLPPKAGYGGYCHPSAPGISRTSVTKALADEAEREGWITRERDRYGGVHNYALTDEGRSVYRTRIAPERDTFIREYLKTKNVTLERPPLRPATAPVKRGAGKPFAAHEERIAQLQRKYGSATSEDDRQPFDEVGGWLKRPDGATPRRAINKTRSQKTDPPNSLRKR